jgi:predicted AAA+ superfamily ATPase
MANLELPSPYIPRVLDSELAELLAVLPVIALEGAKAVGKTATALQYAKTVYRLDEPEELEVIRAEPRRLLEGERPILIDEWQRFPPSWDIARRAADAQGTSPGSLLLTGSAVPPPDASTHSGAGRIPVVRMRPLTLFERGVGSPTVSLTELLGGERPALDGQTSVRLEDYVSEILRSGLPGLRDLSGRPLRAQIEGHVRRIADRDFEEMGYRLRNPALLRRWMTAYAAASSLTTTLEKIRDAASPGEAAKPSRHTTGPYRDILTRLWVVDPVEAWLPSRNYFSRLGQASKHQLFDPAVAAHLLGVSAATLLAGGSAGPAMPRNGTLLGSLFESLVTLDVRVYAQAAEAEVKHFRTPKGDHEVDLIVEPHSADKVLAIEVKLAGAVGDEDDAVKHLRWLQERLGEDLIDAIVITTGTTAYRRQDGIGVVPAALLGP